MARSAPLFHITAMLMVWLLSAVERVARWFHPKRGKFQMVRLCTEIGVKIAGIAR